MQGKRIHDDQFSPGDYGLVEGTWHALTPNGLLANLANHQVIELADGTITVTPSILVSHPSGSIWHGYLERGVWREV